MSAADPRPRFNLQRLNGTSQFDHEGGFAFKVFANRNEKGPASRFLAAIHVQADSGALEVSLPNMDPELARQLATAILKAADDAEAIDAWHLRNPQPLESAA